MIEFPPTRAAALDRLNAFAPNAGLNYARLRNFDVADHPHVSALSPYLTHRVISEEEVLTEVLRHHSAKDAEKFIQEICWRTYWNGVMERRPALWDRYKTDLNASWNQIQTRSGLRSEWKDACLGRTGIDAFDHWATELVETGYLHNHARMWFASIWIFTLRLPWTLGADFFMRHLLDADAASNTLSWRWVAGLQTAGKTYLARPDNIAKYTQGRFRPRGLAEFAAPLDDPNLPPLGPAPVGSGEGFDGFAFHISDLSTDTLPQFNCPVAVLVPSSTEGMLQPSRLQRDFKTALAHDACRRLAKLGETPTLVNSADQLNDWVASHSIRRLGFHHLTIGPSRNQISPWLNAIETTGVSLQPHVRDYDKMGWSAATAGFFKFKSIIPRLLDGLRQPSLI